MLKLLFSSYTYWTLHHEIPFISGEFLAHLYYLKHSFVLVSTVRFLFLSPCSSCLTHSRCVSHLCLTSCHHHHCHSHDCHCHHLHLVPVSDDRSAVSHMVVSVITFSLGCFQVCLNVYSSALEFGELHGRSLKANGNTHSCSETESDRQPALWPSRPVRNFVVSCTNRMILG